MISILQAGLTNTVSCNIRADRGWTNEWTWNTSSLSFSQMPRGCTTIIGKSVGSTVFHTAHNNKSIKNVHFQPLQLQQLTAKCSEGALQLKQMEETFTSITNSNEQFVKLLFYLYGESHLEGTSPPYKTHALHLATWQDCQGLFSDVSFLKKEWHKSQLYGQVTR